MTAADLAELVGQGLIFGAGGLVVAVDSIDERRMTHPTVSHHAAKSSADHVRVPTPAGELSRFH